MSAVRCLTCGWKGNRKTDLAHGERHPKLCPKNHEVIVFNPPPTSVETTPTGVRIEFYDSVDEATGLKQTRRYLVDGEKLPSVTTILRILSKDALLDWVERLTNEGKDWRQERDHAGDRGRQAHDLILRTILKQRTSLADLDDEFRSWGQAAFRWLSTRRPKVIEAERMVASVEHGYSGRIDLLTREGQDVVLWDFKTVSADNYAEKQPYAENALQLDLYAEALGECGYDAPSYGCVVRLGPDGTFTETPFELDYDRGLAIAAAYRARSDASKAFTAGVNGIQQLEELLERWAA